MAEIDSNNFDDQHEGKPVTGPTIATGLMDDQHEGKPVVVGYDLSNPVEVVKVIDPDMNTGYDYDSLYDWEAAQQGDLTGARNEIAVAKCRCTNGTADTTRVTIDGWTTSATQYIKIWTDPTESYRHNGTYQTGNKYRMVFNAEIQNMFWVDESYVKIIGLQFSLSYRTNNNFIVGYAPSGQLLIDKCIFYDGGYDVDSGIILANSGATSVIVNSLFIGIDYPGGSHRAGVRVENAGATAYVYNCTFISCYYGIRNSGTCTAKNCLTSGCTDGFNGTITTSYCATSLSEGLSGTGDRNSQTFTFAGASDYHLAATDAGALGYGTNLYNDATYPFQDDIDGDDRGGSGEDWDIGADEYVTTGGESNGIVWGHENPTGYTEESWSTWKTAAGGSAVVDGDADWGKLDLTSNNHYGPVKDTGNSRGKKFGVKRDSFGTGLGTVTISIRGSTTSFAASDGSPSWEVYSTPINRVWRYVQVKAEKA